MGLAWSPLQDIPPHNKDFKSNLCFVIVGQVPFMDKFNLATQEMINSDKNYYLYSVIGLAVVMFLLYSFMAERIIRYALIEPLRLLTKKIENP